MEGRQLAARDGARTGARWVSLSAWLLVLLTACGRAPTERAPRIVPWRAGAKGGPVIWAVHDQREESGATSEACSRTATMRGTVRVFASSARRTKSSRSRSWSTQERRPCAGSACRCERFASAAGRRRSRIRRPSGIQLATTADPIQVFVEHYLEVRAASTAEWAWKPGSSAAPKTALGFRPVQLVPENAPRDGMPIDVAAPQDTGSLNRDLHRTQSPPGTYEGTIAVRTGGAVREMPVELEVFDFALPDADGLAAMVYFEPSQLALYHGRTDAALEAIPSARPSLPRRARRTPTTKPRSRLDAGRFTGSDFTPERATRAPGAEAATGSCQRPSTGPGEGFEEKKARVVDVGRMDDWCAARSLGDHVRLHAGRASVGRSMPAS